MSDLPPVRYTRIGDESIAYRDLGGDGPAIVYLGTHGSHQDLVWEEPGYAHLLRTLASFGRLVTFDRRGSGLSSHTVKPTIESRVADIETVLDVVEISDAVLVAAGGSGQGALVFAATHPERVTALVLYATGARTTWAPDFPVGTPREIVDFAFAWTEPLWGTGVTAQLYAPSLADDPAFVDWAARSERSVATPVEAREWVTMYDETDVRDVLPHVTAPTLVVCPLHASEYAVGWTRHLADHVTGSELVEIDARDEYPFGEGMEAFLDAVASFLASIVGAPIEARPDRRLAAVLFTDIVGSTEALESVGDRRWRAVLDSHDELARRAVERHRGRVVKSTGDGVLALFDGPASAVEAAFELNQAVERLGIAVRGGVHVGEIEERGDDVAGIAVHVAARVADRAGAGEVLATGVVRDLSAGSGLRFEERGACELRGIPDPLMLLVASRARDQLDPPV